MKNLSALNISNYLKVNNVNLIKSAEKLASGFKINSASDNPSGLTISEKMKAQIRSLDQAYKNSQDVVSLIQVTDSALGEVHSILDRFKEICVQAANDTSSDSDRLKLEDEVSQLKLEIDKIARTTNFNGIKLLDGSLSDNTLNTKPKTETDEEISTSKLDYIKSVSLLTMFSSSNSIFIRNELDDYGEREDILDFSAIKDGSLIVVAGAKFEFDTNGKLQNNDAHAIDIKDLDNNGIKKNFKKVFNSVKPDGIKIKIYEYSDVGYSVIFEGGTDKINVEYKDAVSEPEPDPIPPPVPIPIPKPTSEPNLPHNNLNGIVIQLNSSASSVLINIESVTTQSMNLDKATVATREDASKSIKYVDNAISIISANRAKLGALQNKFEHIMSNLDVSSENLTASNSLIRDTNIAKEVVAHKRFSMLNEFGQILLTQSNKQAQSVVRLLKY